MPYSFGTRTAGSSKLSSKVMRSYVAQLLALYAWKWGVWLPLLLAAGFSGSAWAAVWSVESGLLWKVLGRGKRRREKMDSRFPV